MELKPSLLSSNYKQLSNHNRSWKKVYLEERPWCKMAMDVDSIVFFHIRKYLESPSLTKEKWTMIAASFLYNFDRSVQLMVTAMSKYSIEQFRKTIEFFHYHGLDVQPVFSISSPVLKSNTLRERDNLSIEIKLEIEKMVKDITVPGVRDKVLVLIKKYALYLRDNVRDVVTDNFPSKWLRGVIEADKWCSKNFGVIITEDVDVFLFGNADTIMVRPFLMAGKGPRHFDFRDCRTYFEEKGISSHKEFIQIAFLIGTDYNYGIKGMGPKRSIEAITKYGSVKNYITKKFDLDDESSIRLLDSYRRFSNYISLEMV